MTETESLGEMCDLRFFESGLSTKEIPKFKDVYYITKNVNVYEPFTIEIYASLLFNVKKDFVVTLTGMKLDKNNKYQIFQNFEDDSTKQKATKESHLGQTTFVKYDMAKALEIMGKTNADYSKSISDGVSESFFAMKKVEDNIRDKLAYYWREDGDKLKKFQFEAKVFNPNDVITIPIFFNLALKDHLNIGFKQYQINIDCYSTSSIAQNEMKLSDIIETPLSMELIKISECSIPKNDEVSTKYPAFCLNKENGKLFSQRIVEKLLGRDGKIKNNDFEALPKLYSMRYEERTKFLQNCRNRTIASENELLTKMEEERRKLFVPFFGKVEMDVTCFVFMEVKTLEYEMKIRERKLPLIEVLKMTINVAKGVQALNSFGLVHGNLNPQTIYFQNGAPIIGSVEYSQKSGKSKEDIGSHDPLLMITAKEKNSLFSPPENKYIERSDVYSLGVLILYLLSVATTHNTTEKLSNFLKQLESHQFTDEMKALKMPESLRNLIITCLKKVSDTEYFDEQKTCEALAAFEMVKVLLMDRESTSKCINTAHEQNVAISKTTKIVAGQVNNLKGLRDKITETKNNAIIMSNNKEIIAAKSSDLSKMVNNLVSSVDGLKSNIEMISSDFFKNEKEFNTVVYELSQMYVFMRSNEYQTSPQNTQKIEKKFYEFLNCVGHVIGDGKNKIEESLKIFQEILYSEVVGEKNRKLDIVSFSLIEPNKSLATASTNIKIVLNSGIKEKGESVKKMIQETQLIDALALSITPQNEGNDVVDQKTKDLENKPLNEELSQMIDEEKQEELHLFHESYKNLQKEVKIHVTEGGDKEKVEEKAQTLIDMEYKLKKTEEFLFILESKLKLKKAEDLYTSSVTDFVAKIKESKNEKESLDVLEEELENLERVYDKYARTKIEQANPFTFDLANNLVRVEFSLKLMEFELADQKIITEEEKKHTASEVANALQNEINNQVTSLFGTYPDVMKDINNTWRDLKKKWDDTQWDQQSLETMERVYFDLLINTYENEIDDVKREDFISKTVDAAFTKINKAFQKKQTAGTKAIFDELTNLQKKIKSINDSYFLAKTKDEKKEISVEELVNNKEDLNVEKMKEKIAKRAELYGFDNIERLRTKTTFKRNVDMFWDKTGQLIMEIVPKMEEQVAINVEKVQADFKTIMTHLDEFVGAANDVFINEKKKISQADEVVKTALKSIEKSQLNEEIAISKSQIVCYLKTVQKIQGKSEKGVIEILQLLENCSKSKGDFLNNYDNEIENVGTKKENLVETQKIVESVNIALKEVSENKAFDGNSESGKKLLQDLNVLISEKKIQEIEDVGKKLQKLEKNEEEDEKLAIVKEILAIVGEVHETLCDQISAIQNDFDLLEEKKKNAEKLIEVCKSTSETCNKLMGATKEEEFNDVYNCTQEFFDLMRVEDLDMIKTFNSVFENTLNGEIGVEIELEKQNDEKKNNEKRPTLAQLLKQLNEIKLNYLL
ncbi:golgin IMH1, putative [Entamoeba invadens IP1]|uniref:golgin IMH1, putative n=1 Tax=Entamoeba invadens IP1 TaxID=370355 RepID=UPI0002C3E479|nr:golgin IMH1, putative [Entamoeba invadens IP1]ELP93986.1 golgin IMH1, putative [Entamoeba invadens IP1]|eukprot:XP_004260757.1 golgin IMH1, putative [Entamoeba invadens IP1]